MSSTLSPNMSLIVPTVGSEAGPTYALDINSSLAIIDGHNHSSGSGVQINPSGLNINSALSFQSNPATTLSYASFAVSGSAPSASQSLYVQNGTESPIALPDLWYFDGTNNVQITSGGSVNASIANLPGQSYAAGIFSWKQGNGSTTPANFDIGSIIIRPTVAATTLGTTIAPSSTLASSYTLHLPTALPASTSFTTIDPSGNMEASISTTNGITRTMQAAVGQVISSSFGGTVAGTTGSVLKTITITTTGRPVMVGLVSDSVVGGGGGSAIRSVINTGSQIQTYSSFQIARDYFGFPVVAVTIISIGTTVQTATTTLAIQQAPFGFSLDNPPAGTHTYSLIASGNFSHSTAIVIDCCLVAYEL